MRMTEAEAKTKWCPMARVLVSDSAGTGTANRLPLMQCGPNGEYRPDTSANCLGSACMVWCSGHAAGTGYCGLAGI